MIYIPNTQDAVDELAYRRDTYRHGQGSVDAPIYIYFCGQWVEDNGEW
jgi:hypothetical protein